MKITCDSCGAKYTVSDEKVQGKTVKVKCRKCSAVIVVSSTGQVTTTPEQQAASAAGGDGQVFTVAVADGDQRNMSMAEVVAAYNEGIIDAETYVWAEGMDDWLPLRDVDAIVDALHAAAQGAPEEPQPSQEDLGATVAMTDGMSGAAFAPPAASAPSGGGYPAAPKPAAAAPAPSIPPGGGYAAGLGSSSGFGSSSAARSAQPAAAPNLAGKPTEDSAIFSLNMLTAKAGATEVAAPNFSDEEDSGLIDLKALAAGLSSESVLSAPLDVTGSGGVFPLGAPPPPVAPPVIEEEPKQGMNKGVVVGLGALVVALGAAVVFLVVKGGEPPPAAPTPTVVTVVVTAPSPEPIPEPTATADASASASASAAAKVAGKGPTGGPRPKGTSTGGGSTPTAPAAPAAPRNPCGCDPNDLMCNMRCSQKK